MSKVVFSDGQTQIDYVLVYIRNLSIPPEKYEAISKIRERFIHVLIKSYKIQIEERKVKTKNKEIGFYLLHLPWNVLVSEVERLKLKVPLKKLKQELKHKEMVDRVTHFPFMQKLIKNQEKDQKNNAIQDYHFRTSQRIFVLQEILNSIKYSTDTSFWSKLKSYNRNRTIRLICLLKEGILDAAYPLHDEFIKHYDVTPAEFKQIKSNNLKEAVNRQFLYDHWATWTCLFSYQPVHRIEEYFGPNVAFHFAWLGFYTVWLLPMGILGLVTFFVGIFDSSYSEANDLICGPVGDGILMCPLCQECTRWHLSDVCTTQKVNRLFDSFFTVGFAFLMNIWAIFFLEFWKRYSNQLSYSWNVSNCEKVEKRIRSDYCFYATKECYNRKTQQKEPYFPAYIALFRRSLGFFVLLLIILLIFACHYLVIVLRLCIYHYMFLAEGLRPFSSFVSTLISSFFNLLLIGLIDYTFEAIAIRFTKWEMYRTDAEYEKSLVTKLFIVLSLNYYFHGFYVAFVKGRIRISYNGMSFSETCSHTGCHIEVALYLLMIFVGKQLFKNCFDIAVMRFKRYKNVIKTGLAETVNQWENDYHLNQVTDLIDNFLYIVLQFGLMTLFAAAFPLGPFFAFIINLLTIRISAKKLLCESRRMVMTRANGIGIWYKILSTLSKLSMFTNALIIGFSSDFIEKLIYFLEMRTMSGFTRSNLIKAERDTCYYFPSKHHEEVEFTSPRYLQLICIKLAFVIVYQNVLMLISRLTKACLSSGTRRVPIPKAEKSKDKKSKENPGSKLVDDEVVLEIN